MNASGGRAAHSNLNVTVNHSIKLVFRVQALRWHVALVGMPNSVVLREFQMAASGQHVEIVALEVSIVKASVSKFVVFRISLMVSKESGA